VTRRRPRALLVDMDGTLRHWAPSVPADIERRYGLAAGTIAATVFDNARLVPAVTGQVTHAEWMAGAASALGVPGAIEEWQRYRGEVDTDLLALIRDVRAAGRPVALATNATDRLDADLALLGLVGELDAVVNSSKVGVAKPAPGYFAAACRAIGVAPAYCLLLDDSERFVRGARAYGLLAYRWTGPADLPYLRAALLPRGPED
jgi:putative hydrolase of the HAD superfamily